VTGRPDAASRFRAVAQRRPGTCVAAAPGMRQAIAVALALASGCFRVTTTVVDGRRYDIPGDDGARWNTLVAAEPAIGARCAYWRARDAEVRTGGDVALLGVWTIGTVHPSTQLSAAMAARELQVCAAGE
jgi:hypothetical protein